MDLRTIEEAGITLNRNNRRKIIELIEEIAGRDSVAAADVLADPEIQAVLAHPSANSPQKLATIKAILLKKRFPAVAAAEMAFGNELKKLRLHPAIKITPTPFFEDACLKVEFSYRNPDELQEIARSLQKLSGTDPVKNALDAVKDYC